jgi:ABC-type multidrug transport system fused ATPase/permease subunit
MKDQNDPEVRKTSRLIARVLLYQSAGKSAQIIDSFTTWVLAGVGASMALLLGNLDDVSVHVSLFQFRTALIAYLIGMVFGIAEKFIASYVIGTAESAIEAAEYHKNIHENFENVDYNVIREEFERVTLPSTKYAKRLLHRLLRSSENAHSMAKLSQVQYVLSGLSILFFVLTIASLIHGLQV